MAASPPCAVCGWAEDMLVEDTGSAEVLCYSLHFRTESHLRNYVAWCVYRNEQELGCDYMLEWLTKNRLLDLHHEVLCAESRGASELAPTCTEPPAAIPGPEPVFI